MQSFSYSLESNHWITSIQNSKLVSLSFFNLSSIVYNKIILYIIQLKILYYTKYKKNLPIFFFFNRFGISFPNLLSIRNSLNHETYHRFRIFPLHSFPIHQLIIILFINIIFSKDSNLSISWLIIKSSRWSSSYYGSIILASIILKLGHMEY